MSRASGGESAKGARAEALTPLIRRTKADWKVSPAENRQVFQDIQRRELPAKALRFAAAIPLIQRSTFSQPLPRFTA